MKDEALNLVQFQSLFHIALKFVDFLPTLPLCLHKKKHDSSIFCGAKIRIKPSDWSI